MQYDFTLVIPATKGYYLLAMEQIEAIKKKYSGQHNIQFIMLTDNVQPHDYIEHIFIEHEPWPGITIKKFKYLIKFSKRIKGKYLILQDADTIAWGNKIDFNIFEHDLFAVQHHQDTWYWKKGSDKPFERNPNSLSYVNPENQPLEKPYVMGAVWGGLKDKVLEICTLMEYNIQVDLKNNIVPVYHEESHWNCYVYNNADKVYVVPIDVYNKQFGPSHKGNYSIDFLRGQ